MAMLVAPMARAAAAMVAAMEAEPMVAATVGSSVAIMVEVKAVVVTEVAALAANLCLM